MDIHYKFSEILPVLNKYFGITGKYFNNKATGIDGDAFLNESEVLSEFPPKYVCRDWIINACNVCFKGVEIDPLYIESLYVLANIIHIDPYNAYKQRQLIYNEGLCYNEDIRKDLLHLYIFINTISRCEDCTITFKHKLKSVKLDNCQLWFNQHFVQNYFLRYLPEIKSIDDAERELKKYQKKRGRKFKDERTPIIIYGVYNLLHDVAALKGVTEGFAIFIEHFLNIIDCNGEGLYEIGENESFKERVRHIVKGKINYRFDM